MLKTRVLTAALLFALFLAALFWLPFRYWAALTTLATVVAAWEWAALAGVASRGRFMFAAIVLLACLWITLDAVGMLELEARFWARLLIMNAFIFLWAPAALFWCLVVPFWLWRRWPLNRNIWGRGLLLLLGFFLILATWSLLCFFPYGVSRGFLLWLLGIVWVSDISAYFAGRRFGGKKLAPRISPGKTWAGVYGALAGVLLYWAATTACLTMMDDIRDIAVKTMHPLVLLSFMLFLAVIGILGDLFESLLKRQAGVKDSGNLLPGHGGALDRIDSLMAVLPCAAWLFFALLVFLYLDLG
jgi:phosphatidate cytidylyltransferase